MPNGFTPHDPKYIKPWEIKNGHVVINPNFVSLRDDSSWQPKNYISYLWALKDENNIFVGIETQVARKHTDIKVNATKQGYGHPTLTEGGKALYGGELLYKPSAGGWIINGASGRYGRSPLAVVNSTRLKQVQRLFKDLVGLDVSISEYEVRNG